MSWDPWRFLRDPDDPETEYDPDYLHDLAKEKEVFGDL